MLRYVVSFKNSCEWESSNHWFLVVVTVILSAYELFFPKVTVTLNNCTRLWKTWNEVYDTIVWILLLCIQWTSGSAELDRDLTFMCSCIGSIQGIYKYNQQGATFSRSIYFCKLLYMFQAVPPPIIRSTKLYIQRQVLSNQYCCLLLS
jgi:hypothetical protein